MLVEKWEQETDNVSPQIFALNQSEWKAGE